ncbi:14612_t:CDS:1, partial [Racocetra persica]
MAVALAVPESSLVVRTESKTCNKKRSPLEKRHEDDTCPCTVANAVFQNIIQGIVVFAQDECGFTQAIGLFSSGFKPDNQYCAFITDDCGRILHNITDDLALKFNKDGGTEPFASKLHGVNLNCDKNGILLASTPKPADDNTTHSKRTEDDYYYKDPCASSYRKRAEGSQMRFYENGNNYDQANI